MPDLFVLPRQVPLTSSGGLLPGAKLYFYATGTSTPQNTYSDIALTTPNANPVVADANGVFGKIYLDPSLPHYRVTLKTSAGATIYTEDDVPSNQNTGQVFRLKYTTPELIFQETDASANNGRWAIQANSEQLKIILLDDAESTTTEFLTMSRSGTFAGTLSVKGFPVVNEKISTIYSSPQTNTTNFITVLSTALIGNATYSIDAVLNFNATGAGTTGVKFQLFSTVDTFDSFQPIYISGNVNGSTYSAMGNMQTISALSLTPTIFTVGTLSTSDAGDFFHIRALVSLNTDGFIGIKWACNTNTGQATTLIRKSHIRATVI